MKKIGIVGGTIGTNGFGINLDYIEFIRALEGEPILLFPDSEVKSDLDLLILGGGSDINPLRYNQIPSFYTSDSDPIKEYFDMCVLPLYIKANVPIFGICRGLQNLAVTFGYTLIQECYHPTNPKDDPCKLVHKVHTTNNETFEVNSRHHQCVNNKSTRDPFVLASFGTDIEAMRFNNNIAGVQWHPENMNPGNGFKWTINLINQIIKK